MQAPDYLQLECGECPNRLKCTGDLLAEHYGFVHLQLVGFGLCIMTRITLTPTCVSPQKASPKWWLSTSLLECSETRSGPQEVRVDIQKS